MLYLVTDNQIVTFLIYLLTSSIQIHFFNNSKFHDFARFNLISSTSHPLQYAVRLHEFHIRHKLPSLIKSAAVGLGKRCYVAVAIGTFVAATKAIRARVPEDFKSTLWTAAHAELGMSNDAPVATENSANKTSHPAPNTNQNGGKGQNWGGGKGWNQNYNQWSNGGWNNKGWNNWIDNKGGGKGKNGKKGNKGKKGQTPYDNDFSFDNNQAIKIPQDVHAIKNETMAKCKEHGANHMLAFVKCPHNANCKSFQSGSCPFAHDPKVKPVYTISGRSNYESLKLFFGRSGHGANT